MTAINTNPLQQSIDTFAQRSSVFSLTGLFASLKRAADNLNDNTLQVTLNGQSYNVIRPGDLYPGVWGWDAAFHAIGLAHESGQRGLEELEISSLGQTAEGMLPHILFYDSDEANETYYPGPQVWENTSATGLPISGISQPPVFGFALEQIIETDPTCQKDHLKIRELFNVAYHYQKWWYEERNPEGNGLVVSIHPWETGRDNPVEWDPIFERIKATPEFQFMAFDPSIRRDIKIDEHGNSNEGHRPSNDAYKMFTYLLKKVKDNGYSIKDEQGQYKTDFPFAVQDITINAMLQASNESLIRLANTYGTQDQKEQLERWSAQTCASFQKLWNEQDGAFQSRDITTGTLTDTTNGSFMAMATSAPTQEQAERMARVLDDWKARCGVEYHICSTRPDHPDFEAKRYWRGPVWTIVNYVAAHGFLMQGERFQNPELLSHGLEITHDSIKLVQDDPQFSEYHNPINGDGCGAKNFGFTSVAFLGLLRRVQTLHQKVSIQDGGDPSSPGQNKA